LECGLDYFVKFKLDRQTLALYDRSLFAVIKDSDEKNMVFCLTRCLLFTIQIKSHTIPDTK